MIFSLLGLLLIVFGITWWGMKGVSDDGLIEKNKTLSQDSSLTPIEKALEVKEMVESKTEEPESTESQRTTLNLSGQGLTKAPQYIFDRTSLNTLNLSYNNIGGSLQAEIRQLTQLRTLNLSHNSFTGVPAEVGQLANLEVLDLSYNPITGLPYEIGNLKQLKTLDLRGTQYSTQDLEVIRKNLPLGARVIVD
jgi:Leucine-rich repeat (LRR) protein